MGRKSLMFIVLTVCTVSFSFAQIVKAQTLKTVLVKGQVIAEEDRAPILGVTVLVKGTKNGVSTDFDGKFAINVNIGDVLIFSSIGFETQEYRVRDKDRITIIMSTNMEALTEIMVIGYGTQEKRSLTGSISSIKGKDLDQTAVSFDNALSGKLPGVLVNSSSGAVGGATSITIRGISSLSANSNNPLIVIDGVPIYGTDRKNNTTGFGRTSIPGIGFGGPMVQGQLNNKEEFERNPLSMLNPNDIESIEVLKDAYATAIYGSRGAAGVILVTTKNGASGKPKVNFNYSTTFSDPVDTPDIMNARQYSEFYNTKSGGNNYPLGEETDWLGRALRTSITNSANLSIAAGTDDLKYYFSFSALDQESYIVEQDYTRYSTRLNLDYKFSEKFKFGSNVSINYSDNNALNAQSIYRNSVLKGPNIKAMEDPYTYYFGFAPNTAGFIDNPLAQAYKDTNYATDNRVIGNVFIEYSPLKWLTLKSEIGIDNLNTEAFSRIISRPDIEGGNATQTTNKNRKFVTNNTITINKVFDNIHSLNAVLGQSFETSREQSTSIFGRQFHSDRVMAIGQAGVKGVQRTFVGEWALFSVFGRLNYQYDHKYLAGVTYRLDGSSRFNKNNRYIGFPSFSLGWRASNEDFMKDLTWLGDLKFRGSIGFTGIDGTSGYYGNQGQYTLDPHGLQYAGAQILEVKQPNNPNLKWENTRTLDLGVDVSLFNNRIDLTVDYYHKKITNMLYSSAVPWFLGYGSQQQNIGDMENKGFEIGLNTQNIVSPNFRWTTNFNISRNTNKILKLNFGGNDVTGPELGYKYFAEGQSAGQFFLYDWAGVNPLTGNPLWDYPDGTQSETPPASLNNSSKYRKPMGDALPDFYGGLTNTFTYKNWKLDAFFSFSYGNQLYNGTKALLHTYTSKESHNLSTDMLDYWIIPGQITDVPKLDNSSVVSTSSGSTVDYISGRQTDRFLEDASFIRLKTISLTYSLPDTFIQNTFFDNLSIYIQANNILTFTEYSGLDPEVSAFGSSALLSGYDELTLPQSKSYSIGVNVGF